MPEPPAARTKGVDLYAAAQTAWEALDVANNLFACSASIRNERLIRLSLPILRSRALLFAAAIEAIINDLPPE